MIRLLVLSFVASSCRAFVTLPRGLVQPAARLFSTTDDISSMRAGEIKKELESYGISTKSFLEKKELVEALVKARGDGMVARDETKTSNSSTSGSSTSSSAANDASKSREDCLIEEMEKLRSRKAADLKKELESLGVSTKSFFEKSEFVKALAEAIVDGVQEKESYAEYADVEVLTSDDAGPRKRGSQDAQPSQQKSPFGGGGGSNPFGGGGMPGGMGGMADMLKNMGMGGMGGGVNPFGGAGGNPFGGTVGANPFGGDMMGKAQQMMKNPKVMELMAKAQSNPKMMKAMQECMSNPAAFAKYQNDPEVADLIKELKNLM